MDTNDVLTLAVAVASVVVSVVALRQSRRANQTSEGVSELAREAFDREVDDTDWKTIWLRPGGVAFQNISAEMTAVNVRVEASLASVLHDVEQTREATAGDIGPTGTFSVLFSDIAAQLERDREVVSARSQESQQFKTRLVEAMANGELDHERLLREQADEGVRFDYVFRYTVTWKSSRGFTRRKAHQEVVVPAQPLFQLQVARPAES